MSERRFSARAEVRRFAADFAVRRFDAALAAIACGLLAYLACAHANLPQWWYRVLDRSWSFGARPQSLAMGWYGRTAWVALAAAAGAALGALLPRSDRVLVALFAVTLGLVIATSAIIVADNLHRPTTPLRWPASLPPDPPRSNQESDHVAKKMDGAGGARSAVAGPAS